MKIVKKVARFFGATSLLLEILAYNNHKIPGLDLPGMRKWGLGNRFYEIYSAVFVGFMALLPDVKTIQTTF